MTTTEFIIKLYKLGMPQNARIVEMPNIDRETLAELFYELGFTKGAEIGVERGIYSEILLKKNPDLYLYSIDAWTAYKGYRDHVTQSKMDKLFADCKERLARYSSRNKIIKAFSVEAAKDFDDESLDFVYIDANHEFAHTVADISAWDKKVKVGGIVAGHDYILRKNNGYLMHVPHALDGWCKSYGIQPLFVLGRKEKLPGEKRDSARSWFYVKQAVDIIPAKPLEF